MEGSPQAPAENGVASGSGRAIASIGVRAAAIAVIGFGASTVVAALIELVGPAILIRNLPAAYTWLSFIFDLDQRGWALFGLGALLVVLGILSWRESLAALVTAIIVVGMELVAGILMVLLLNLFTGEWDRAAITFLLVRVVVLGLLGWAITTRRRGRESAAPNA